jgi:hypothetical protein
MLFTQEVLNGFQMTHRTAATEIPATRAGHRSFAGVYPPYDQKRISLWRVRRFEIPKELVDNYFGEEQLVDSEKIELNTLEEVEELLAKWNVDSASFEAPWKNDWPL